MATKSLDELKAKLYKAFDSAGQYVDDSDAAERIAMGTIAQALVAIEREQREAAGTKIVKLDGK